ncbi:MAG: hypothetical protein ACLS43_09485 [Evtepia gabavorous]
MELYEAYADSTTRWTCLRPSSPAAQKILGTYEVTWGEQISLAPGCPG